MSYPRPYKTTDGLVAVKADVADITGPTNIMGKLTVTAVPPFLEGTISDTVGNKIISGSFTPPLNEVLETNVRTEVDLNPGLGVVQNLTVGLDCGILGDLVVFGSNGISTGQAFFKYSESTWNPTLPNVTASPLTIVYATYTKIGNQVSLYFSMLFDYTFGSGTVTIAGLPFTPAFDNQSGHINAVDSNLQTVPPIVNLHCAVVSGVIVLSTGSTPLSWVGSANSQEITGNITYTST